MDGFGIGLVLRARGTTGGTDIVAQLLYKYRRIPFGQVFFWSNTLILLCAIPVVGLVPVLYALIVNAYRAGCWTPWSKAWATREASSSCRTRSTKFARRCFPR